MSGVTEVKAALAVLKHCSSRIMHTAEEALHLWEVWCTFNQAAELRSAIRGSQAELAAAVYEKASLDMLVIVVVRLLEGPAEDRRNFQIFQKYLRFPGVAEALIKNAANSMAVLWDGADPEEASTTVRDRIEAFHVRLDRLKEKEYGRLKMLGRHRNANLGHELIPDPSEPRPTHDMLRELVNEGLALADDVEAIVPSGCPLRREEASKSAAALWKAVVAASPAEG